MTAYDVRISDWSSDVCSSDLVAEGAPARSLVFLAVTAEEAGLIGSDYYATHPVYRLGKTVGGINIDVLNEAGRARDMVVIGRGKPELEAILARWSARQDRVRSEEHTSELQSLMRITYSVFCLDTKNN